MAQIRCDKVTPGLRESEVLAQFSDVAGRRHFIRVERDFLGWEGETPFLSVGVVGVDPKTKNVLVELPHEAETGANRVWIKPDQLDAPLEAFV